MGYDCDLVDPVTKEVLQLDQPHQMKGGTYCVGGTTDASLAVTYNYGGHFSKAFGDTDTELSPFERCFGGGKTGLRRLRGMTGAESIPVLQSAIARLGDDVSNDYWEATEGNAKRALVQLLALAQLRPDGIWEIR